MNLFTVTLLTLLSSLIKLAYTPQNSTEKLVTLSIEVVSLRNNTGVVKLSIFNQEDGFPSNAELASQVLDVAIQHNTAQITLPKLPYGTYAIAVLHDENGNGKMDTNLIGIPAEGYGTSKDVKALFGPPKFKDAKFSLNAYTGKLKIAMKYF